MNVSSNHTVGKSSIVPIIAMSLVFMLNSMAECDTPLYIQNNQLSVLDIPSSQFRVLAKEKGYFPVLNEFDNKLFAVIRAGAGHLGLGGALELIRSTSGATDWQTPIEVVNGPLDDRNPAVGFTASGRLITAYHEQGSYDSTGHFDSQNAFQRSRCMVTMSDDFGTTWSSPMPLGIPGLEAASPYGRIIRTATGELLMNIYIGYHPKLPGVEHLNPNRKNVAYLVRSSDEGMTWSEPSIIADGHNETALIMIDDGRLLAVGRTSGSQRLNFMLSNDEGRTWSYALRLTGPMQHPADLIQLSNGWILMVYGDRSREEKTIQGVISRDRCRSWDVQYKSIFSRPVYGDFGYPSIVALEDGTLALMYYQGGSDPNGKEARANLVLFNEADFIQAYHELTGF